MNSIMCWKPVRETPIPSALSREILEALARYNVVGIDDHHPPHLSDGDTFDRSDLPALYGIFIGADMVHEKLGPRSTESREMAELLKEGAEQLISAISQHGEIRITSQQEGE